MKKKAARRIRKWGEYNASLKQRGSGAIWVSSEAIANWTTDELTGQPGASPNYTDLAIETAATVQVFVQAPAPPIERQAMQWLIQNCQAQTAVSDCVTSVAK